MNKHINKKKGAVIVMAYASCAANIKGNIAMDCDNPIVGGYTGRGVLINVDELKTMTRDGSNPRTISAITIATGASTTAVDNTAFAQPFNSSTVQSTDENGMVQYTKTFVVNIPLRGSTTSKFIVEPLHKSALGFLLILEKKDKVGNGSYVVVGAEQGLKATADGVVRNEYENGGSIVATLSTTENFFEEVFFDTDYETTKTAFEALLAQSA